MLCKMNLTTRRFVFSTFAVGRAQKLWGYRQLSYFGPARNASPESPSPEKKPSQQPEPPRHGFDASKPRKPLSRITIGSEKLDSEKSAIQQKVGFFNWKAGVVFILTGVGLTLYFQREKRRLEIEKQTKASEGHGKTLVGGPFSLIDQNGNAFTDEDLKGKFSLIYFGFTLCPDVCPEELEKGAQIVNNINKNGKVLQPIFVTCDPNRDTPEVIKEYLEEFHPDYIGLTGSYEDIKKICKEYRVYFSTPPDLKPGESYLVDHSIFFFLMDPEGNFVDVMGKNYDAPQATEKILDHIANWKPRIKN